MAASSARRARSAPAAAASAAAASPFARWGCSSAARWAAQERTRSHAKLARRPERRPREAPAPCGASSSERWPRGDP
eukprot:1453164-Prymnesium_polylepis.1